MKNSTIERGMTLSERVRSELRNRIRSMRDGDTKLPSEENLSAEYGVSRAIIREACAHLISEGYISKRKSGLYAHPIAFRMTNRIDLSPDFRRLVENAGGAHSLKISKIHEKAPEEEGIHDWENAPCPVLSTTWVYRCDETPVICGYVEFLTDAMATVPEGELYSEGFREFTEEYLKTSLAFCAVKLCAVTYEKAANALRIAPDRPMLMWNETLVDEKDRIVGYGQFYMHPDRIPLSLMTKF